MNPATNSISIPPSPLSRPPPPSEIEINQPPPSVATNTNDNDNRGIVPRFLIRIKNLFAKLLVPFSWIPKRWRLSGVFPPNHFPTDIKTANDPLGSSDPVSTFRHKLKTQHPDLKKRSLLARFDVDDDVVLGNILSVLHEPDLNIGEEAFMNTLKFREEYEPFTASQALIKENKAGFVYTRKETLAGNPIVHYIPARAVSKNSAYYSRSLVYSLERAISRMERSNKYFVVIDCSNFGLSSIPSVKDIKQLFGILAAHYPQRLGKVMIVNLGRAAKIFYNLSLTFVPEGTKSKIVVASTIADLEAHIGLENLPRRLGGEDEYVFEARAYFEGVGDE